MKQPLVSVLLSVFNGERTLTQALNSIAAQTYRPLEIIAVDDASTDNSSIVLSDWAKEHHQLSVTIVRNDQNIGLTRSLMRALSTAHGQLIARLDADDWWAPEKLTKQVAYLTAHPACGLVGSWYINVRSGRQQHVRLPVNHREIQSTIFWRNPFGHSCVLLRRNALDKVGGYDTALRYGQDRDLWFRLFPHTTMHNLPETLCYRTVDPAISTTNHWAQVKQQCKTVQTYIQRYRASPLNYLSLLEPLVLVVLPAALKTNVRKLFMKTSGE